MTIKGETFINQIKFTIKGDTFTKSDTFTYIWMLLYIYDMRATEFDMLSHNIINKKYVFKVSFSNNKITQKMIQLFEATTKLLLQANHTRIIEWFFSNKLNILASDTTRYYVLVIPKTYPWKEKQSYLTNLCTGHRRECGAGWLRAICPTGEI